MIKSPLTHGYERHAFDQVLIELAFDAERFFVVGFELSRLLSTDLDISPAGLLAHVGKALYGGGKRYHALKVENRPKGKKGADILREIGGYTTHKRI